MVVKLRTKHSKGCLLWKPGSKQCKALAFKPTLLFPYMGAGSGPVFQLLPPCSPLLPPLPQALGVQKHFPAICLTHFSYRTASCHLCLLPRTKAYLVCILAAEDTCLVTWWAGIIVHEIFHRHLRSCKMGITIHSSMVSAEHTKGLQAVDHIKPPGPQVACNVFVFFFSVIPFKSNWFS